MHYRRWSFALIACGLIGFGAEAARAASPSESFPAPLVEAGPALSLETDGPPWDTAFTVRDFTTVTTRTTAARFPTQARILIDRTTLYVAIHAEQRGAPIVATQTTNNVGFGNDDFAGVGIDPTGNGNRVYYFETTPAGVRYQQSSESVRFAPAWRSLAKRREGGWDAVLAIPLAVLRSDGAGAGRWRINLVRHVAAANENQSWAYDPLIWDGVGGGGSWPVFTDARFWPYLTGATAQAAAARSKPKPRLEIYGLASAGGDRDVFARADGSFHKSDVRNAGLDLSLPLSGTMNFVGTLAPDFSNVEVDQQTISPQQFRRNLTEYRPFFAQGANFFQPVVAVSVNQAANVIFYSPSIGQFVRGEKIEGTYGLQSLGLLNVKGAGFDDTIFSLTHSLPDKTFKYMLTGASVRHQDGNDTTSPLAQSDTALEAQVGGRNLHNGFVYGASYAGERGSLTGTPRLAYKTQDYVDIHRQNYEINVVYTDIGPTWNPPIGFTNLADLRGLGSFFDLIGNPPPASPLKRAELFLFADRLIDRSGAAHEIDSFANLDLLFRNQLHLQLTPSVSALRLYDGGRQAVGYSVGYRDGVTVPFNSHGINLGYKDGSPTPLDASFSFGPFTTFTPDGFARPTYLRQFSFSTSRPLGTRWTLGFEYDGTLERFPEGDPLGVSHDAQFLRRLSLGESLGAEANLSLSLRAINGTGGFGVPGTNLAGSYHRRFNNDSELFVNYGTPAANVTLERWVVKYLIRFGSGAGT